jgi:hypothetical protein
MHTVNRMKAVDDRNLSKIGACDGVSRLVRLVTVVRALREASRKFDVAPSKPAIVTAAIEDLITTKKAVVRVSPTFRVLRRP